MRVFDAGNPASPALTKSVIASGSTTPVSITVFNNNVYVAGDQLYSYDLQLGQRVDNPPAFLADPVAGFSFRDQRVGPYRHLPSRQPQRTAAVGRSRRMRRPQTAGRLYLLTDDSVEIWSTSTTAPQPPRRRSASH